jgi:hypothetical protein
MFECLLAYARREGRAGLNLTGRSAARHPNRQMQRRVPVSGEHYGSMHWSKEAPSFGLAFPWAKVRINGIYPWRISTMMEAIIR